MKDNLIATYDDCPPKNSAYCLNKDCPFRECKWYPDIEMISWENYLEALSRLTEYCIYEDEEDCVECFNYDKKNNNQCDKCDYYIYYIKKRKA